MKNSRPHLLVLGGGQLARMMLPAAARLDIAVTVLDPAAASPAAALAHGAIAGNFRDGETVRRAVGDTKPDLITIEIEDVHTGALSEAIEKGILVYPSPATIETINDKLRQRSCFETAGLPSPKFVPLPDGAKAEEIESAVAAVGLPAIQKVRRGGYDGRGVAEIDTGGDQLPLTGPSILEARVDVEREAAVLVARSAVGECVAYEPFEMEMDPELHLLRSVFYPPSPALTGETAKRAQEIAIRAVEALSGVGLFAVELFLSREGDLLVNEVAPRPHNSGHLTIEASETDQFEQHLRAIFGLPLGSTRMREAACMRNLVGSGQSGPPRYAGLEEALAVDGAHVHLYGKSESRPGRKMGHITVCRPGQPEARRACSEAASRVTVMGES